MKRILTVLALSLLPSLTAFASADGPGCGVGQMMFKGSSGLISHILALSTNGTFSASFAVTSGTSGCDTSATVRLERERSLFVTANHHTLSLEIAQGGGAYVRSLASLMGCGSVSTAFARAVQEKYGVLFASDRSIQSDLIGELRQVIQASPQLAAGCTIS